MEHGYCKGDCVILIPIRYTALSEMTYSFPLTLEVLAHD